MRTAEPLDPSLLCAFLLLLGAATGRAAGDPAPSVPARPGWHLVWRDEFDGDSVDPAKWRVEDAALVKNNELQYYAPDEVHLQDGCLVLRSQKRVLGERNFTSGLVESKGRFAQAGGRFEIRAKLPRGQGIWPAHWLLPDDGSWPPEIDIIESIGSQPNTVVMSLHNGHWPDIQSQTMDFMGPDFSQDFHVFALEWDPNELRWYVDGELRFSTQDEVPQVPMYVILNTAVGGNMPGEPDETTVFPQYHYIDYVRVYGREVPGRYYLTAAADHGRVAVDPVQPTYTAGSKVKLSVTPAIGYVFSHWSGDLEGKDNPVVVAMDGHKAVTAHFAPDPNAPPLLSVAKPVTASSVEDGRFPPAAAVDGDRKTRWSSAFADRQSILVDLGQVRSIEAIRLDWENAYAKTYAIDVSDDGTTWRSAHYKSNGRGRTEEIINMTATGRFVRLTGLERGTEWGVSLWEFSVFGR